jgi:hypothetical protein
MKSTVKFNPDRVKVDGGIVYGLTEIIIPETEKTNRCELEISAFECGCGYSCPDSIYIVSTVKDYEDVEMQTSQHISIPPEDLLNFIDALKKSYEAILMKKN